MTLAELPAPLTRGKRWAKHAAERDQQIQNEIIAIKVLLPNMSDEDIRRCLKEHGGQTDLALSKLLDAQEVDLLGGLLDETEPPKEPKQEEVSTAASQGANLDGQQIPSSQSVYVAEELAEVPKHKAEPKPLGPPESPAPTPSVPSVPKWLPMLQPSDPAELSSKCLSQLLVDCTCIAAQLCRSTQKTFTCWKVFGLTACAGGRFSMIGRRSD